MNLDSDTICDGIGSPARVRKGVDCIDLLLVGVMNLDSVEVRDGIERPRARWGTLGPGREDWRARG